MVDEAGEKRFVTITERKTRTNLSAPITTKDLNQNELK